MRVYISIMLFFVYQFAYAEDTLCTEKEKIIFSCHTKNKIISLCASLQAEKSLVYRYGKLGHEELIYSEPVNHNKSSFYTSAHALYGGDETSIAFKIATYEYKIYSQIGRADSDDHQEDRIPKYEDGLTIFLNGKVLKNLVCDDGGAGFREDISWIPSRN